VEKSNPSAEPAKERRFALPQPRQITEQQRAAIESIEASRGKVPAPFIPLLSDPEVALAFERFSSLLWRSLPPLPLEVVFLVVARRFYCSYQWKTHEKKAIDLGLTAAELGEIAESGIVKSGRFSDMTRFVGALLEGVDPPEALYQAMKAEITSKGVANLVAFTGASVTVALLLNLNQEG
jgi:hypothetical protein